LLFVFVGKSFFLLGVPATIPRGDRKQECASYCKDFSLRSSWPPPYWLDSATQPIRKEEIIAESRGAGYSTLPVWASIDC